MYFEAVAEGIEQHEKYCNYFFNVSLVWNKLKESSLMQNYQFTWCLEIDKAWPIRLILLPQGIKI